MTKWREYSSQGNNRGKRDLCIEFRKSIEDETARTSLTENDGDTFALSLWLLRNVFNDLQPNTTGFNSKQQGITPEAGEGTQGSS